MTTGDRDGGVILKVEKTLDIEDAFLKGYSALENMKLRKNNLWIYNQINAVWNSFWQKKHISVVFHKERQELCEDWVTEVTANLE